MLDHERWGDQLAKVGRGMIICLTFLRLIFNVDKLFKDYKNKRRVRRRKKTSRRRRR